VWASVLPGKKLDGPWVHSRSCELLPWIVWLHRSILSYMHSQTSDLCFHDVAAIHGGVHRTCYGPRVHPIFFCLAGAPCWLQQNRSLLRQGGGLEARGVVLEQ
jgi:hypothetical protein